MFVFSNLATSLDGKIATASRALYPLGTPEDRRLMQILRKRSDVVLFGASTLRAFKKPCVVTGPLAARTAKQPANAVVSSTLEGFSPEWPFFARGGFSRILFVGHRAPVSRLRKFEKSSEIVQLPKLGKSASVAKLLLSELARRGFVNVLVEGGGSLMWDFVREDLIDEYHVTLTPKLVGGTESPTLVDGQGFEPADILNLRLKRCRKVGNELYLTYGKTGRRG